MSRLIWLYPREWRERYGDELAVVLEDRPPGLGDSLDLLLGALDAHLHHEGVAFHGTSKEKPRMAIRSVHPVLLLAMSLGTLLVACGVIIGVISLANPDPLRWAGWGPAGFTAAAALLLAGLALAFWRPAIGALLGAAGAVLLVAAAPWLWMFAIGIGLLAAVPFILSYQRAHRTSDPA